MQFLKQSTGVDVRLGPFVDATDGVTPETGVALGTADQAELLKHDGAATVDISGRTFTAVTGCDGWYDLTLTTTDTNTLGMMTVVVQDSSVCLPVFKDFMVVPKDYWNMVCDDGLALITGYAAKTGTLTTTSFTTTLNDATEYNANDALNGRVIIFVGDQTAALRGQAAVISDYSTTNGTVTVDTAFTAAPANNDSFVIV